MPLAERTGLIVEVSQWAMKTAMRQIVAASVGADTRRDNPVVYDTVAT